MGDWIAILYPKIDRVGKGARGLGRCESSLIDFIACHDLVDRFRLDHPGREMWMWLDRIWHKEGKLFGQSVRRADTDFVMCPMFRYVACTDHRFVRVRLWLDNRPSLTGYWKFNTLLTGDVGLLGPAGILSSVGISGGGGTWNKWWGFL